MEFLFQLLIWTLFGYISYKIVKNNMNFEFRIWAAIDFVFGFIGLVVLMYFLK